MMDINYKQVGSSLVLEEDWGDVSDHALPRVSYGEPVSLGRYEEINKLYQEVKPWIEAHNRATYELTINALPKHECNMTWAERKSREEYFAYLDRVGEEE